MNELDQNIRKALASEDAELHSRLDEQSISEQVIDSFRRRGKWLVVMAFGAGLTWLVVGCVTAYQFFQADDTRGMIAWAAGFVSSLVAIGLVKIWYWMELNKNAVTREVKRVELRLSQLADQLGAKTADRA